MSRGLPILLVVTVMAYAGLWSAGFVWDDIPLIVNNHALREATLGTLFTSDLWASSGAGDVASGYYRPLVLVSFAVDRWAFGLNPLGYHLHSLGWHLLAMVGLHRLCLPLFDRQTALLAVALFGLHPVQSEVVAWVSARNDLMAAALGFLALSMVWIDDRPRPVRVGLAMVLTVCAGLSKETALLLPVLLGAADWCRGRSQAVVARQVPLLAGVAVVLLMRTWVGVGEATVPTTEGVWLMVVSLPTVLGGYAASVLSPWPLSSAYDLTWASSRSLSRLALGWIGIVAVALCIGTARESRRRVGLLGLIWALVLLGITFVPTADKGGYGDRFLYWPMAGIAVALASVLRDHAKVVAPVFVVTALLTVHVRLPDWQHDRSLWGAAVRDIPTPTNEVSLGHALTLHQRHKRAHVSFVSALAKPGIDLEACGPVVGSAMRTGLPELALRMGDWAIARGCTATGPMNGWMAMAAAYEGEWTRAEAWAFGGTPDPRFRDLVVQAAVAKRNGDEAAYADLEQNWPGPDPLWPQVEALLNR